jgi:hypothetical protein
MVWAVRVLVTDVSQGLCLLVPQNGRTGHAELQSTAGDAICNSSGCCMTAAAAQQLRGLQYLPLHQLLDASGVTAVLFCPVSCTACRAADW